MIDWNPNNPHRPSYVAHNVLYDMADDFFKDYVGFTSIFSDRTKKEKVDKWFGHAICYMPSWSKSGRMNFIHGKCESWFRDNCNRMIEGFFHAAGYKDIEDAFVKTDCFNDLTAQWDEWFERKREYFMAKQNEEIVKIKGIPAKLPSSHGGVANLLKTLTKTMQTQGASIQSIAKMQYAICKQAGIYIIDEFITDVAVALDYEERLNAVEK